MSVRNWDDFTVGWQRACRTIVLNLTTKEENYETMKIKRIIDIVNEISSWYEEEEVLI